MFLSLSGVTDSWQSPILNYNNKPINKQTIKTTIRQMNRQKKKKEIALVRGGDGRGRAGGSLACSDLESDAITDVELGLNWSFWYRWLKRFWGIFERKKTDWEMGFDEWWRRVREMGELLDLTSDDTADFISFQFLLGLDYNVFPFWGWFPSFFCFLVGMMIWGNLRVKVPRKSLWYKHWINLVPLLLNK